MYNQTMRVLIATGRMFPDEVGGLARVVTGRARGLAARGHQVTVVTRNPGDLPPHETRDGFAIERFPSPAKPLWRYHASYVQAARCVDRAARRTRAQVVDLYHPLLGSLVRHQGAPRVYNFYSSWALEWLQEEEQRERSPRRRLLGKAFARYLMAAERRTLQRSRRVIVLSRFSGDLCKTIAPVDNRVRLITGSADLDRFEPGPPDRAACGLPEGPLVLAVRRLVPRMGFELLIDTMARLPGVHLAVAGRGPLLESLQQRARDQGIDDRITWLGFVPDELLPVLYRSADLTVTPTVAYEGFGLVVAEALACGTPTVVTPVAALPELVGPLDPALVASSPTPEALAQAIRHGLDAPPSVDACRQRALDFSPERELDAYESVLSELT